jgi:hypothetical protein
MDTPSTPNCDRLWGRRDELDALTSFLELLSEKKLQVCEIPESERDRIEQRWLPIGYRRLEEVLMEFLGIDHKELERERRALVAAVQAAADQRRPT